MTVFRNAARTLKRFARNQKGTTAITFALSIVPVLLAVAAGVDYARYTKASTQLQAALDSGALAIASSPSLSDAARLKMGREAFVANLKDTDIRPQGVTSNFTFVNQQVRASASYPLPAGLMQIAGLSAFEVEAQTAISIPKGRKAEIAMVLDYSGSMTEVSGGQVKYVAMKNAAQKLASDLQKMAPGRVKMGLVPFSHYVYVTLPANQVLNATGTYWTGCTPDRLYPYNLGDSAPTTDNATKWGQPVAKVHAADGCSGYVKNNLKVMPLTKDLDAVKAQLEIMRPYAWTHIALGAEFGYQLLSPSEPFTGAADFSDGETQKIMVLLTDGRQTEPAYGDGVRTVNQGESNLEAICRNMKDRGISIVTIAFDLRDKDTRKRLSDCSSDPSKDFYVAEEGSDVAAAFDDIRKKVTAQVFISK